MQKFWKESRRKIFFIIFGAIVIGFVFLCIYCLQRKCANMHGVSALSILEEQNQVLDDESPPQRILIGEYYIDERWANTQIFPDMDLNYFGTLNMKMDTYDGTTIIRKLHDYEEKEGIFYTFDNRSRLYAIESFNKIDATVDIGEEEIVKSVYTFLEGKIENLNCYKVDNIRKTDNCYKMQLRSKNDDIIDLTVESDGDIQLLVCRYHSVGKVSKKEKQYFDTKLDTYLKEHLEEYESYEYTVNYEEIDEKIYAFYVITFQRDGINFLKNVIFSGS